MHATARWTLSAWTLMTIKADSNPTNPWVALSIAAFITGFAVAFSRLSPTTHVTAIARLNNEFTIQPLWTIIANKNTAVVNKQLSELCGLRYVAASSIRIYVKRVAWNIFKRNVGAW